MTMVIATEIKESDRIAEFNKHFSWFLDQNVTDWLYENGFFRQAASTKFHGSYEGGLFDHSLSVMLNLNKLTGRLDLKWERMQSPFIVGMFHDLCKIDQYEKKNGSFIWKKSELPGHGDKSVILLSRLMKLTEEEMACIRYHMGAFTDKEEWTKYTDAIHTYKNVLYTHTADMIASHIEMT